MIPAPVVDGRRFESLLRELRQFAPHYVPDLNLSVEEGVGVALMKIAAQLAEKIAVRLDQAPQKHFVAFLDQLGINLLPARPARVNVTFRLASGFEQSVFVPAGTRVTAPGDDGDISFETTGELVVIPGALTTAYGTDPVNDLIFHHPPGFLDQVPRTPTELEYTIQSFVPAKSTRLQLNHTTELTPGAFIVIDETEKAVIQKVDEGGFITLTNPVTQDFTPGTTVLPIRDFEVFDGIDLQEHVLFLGHTGIFNVKEEVEIKLSVELSDAELEPLDLVWQFWTKRENQIPEQDDHWEDLKVVLDGTAGLSSSGEIVLVKEKGLEIKTLKIAGRESRWIRAKLREKLTTPVRALPEIETIQVGVNTPKGANLIFADQGFYNATPLDVKVDPGVGFFPFGTEPRQFDQFYIASKEAFSKRDANVRLHFDVDLQTLAAPSVVQLTNGLRAYAIGLRRRLYELNESGSFNILGTPESPFVPLKGSRPSALIIKSTAEILNFVTTEDTLNTQDPDNKIWVHKHQSNQATGTWTDLDAPPQTQKKLLFSPTAVFMPNQADMARVFVVGADGQLYSRIHDGGGWESHVAPDGIKFDSPPFVVTTASSISVFLTGNGIVHWLTLEVPAAAGGPLQPKWKLLRQGNVSFTATYRPFAQLFTTDAGVQAKVFVFGFLDQTDKTSGKLFECDTRSESSDGTFHWDDRGQPTPAAVTDTAPEAHAPNGYLGNIGERNLDLEDKHIFLRSVDGHLYERTDQGWEDRMRTDDPNLRDSPAINTVPPPSDASTADPVKLNVFLASGRNSLVRWDFEIRAFEISPNDRDRGVPLDEHASDDHELYKDKDIKISFRDQPDETRKIRAYDGDLALVRLKDQLSNLSNASTWEIEVTSTRKDKGDIGDEADRIFVVHDPDNTIVPLLVRINDNFEDLNRYSGRTGLVIDVDPGDLIGIYGLIVGGSGEFPSPEDTGTVPELSWEYWNGTGWLSIREVSDSTRNLLRNGDVTFPVPNDIQPTEVAGQENFWVRARLAGGDYGRETFKIVSDNKTPPTQTVVSDKSSLRPPKVRALGIAYQAKPVAPEICLTFNNLDYLDQTAAAQAPDSRFLPFTTLEEKSLTIFFGFDKPFRTGPVRILLDAAERNVDEDRRPEFAWFFRKDRIWKPLDANDDSLALTRQGILTLSASEELTREIRFGEPLFWIRGTLRTERISQAKYPLPLLRGIFPNTVAASQGQTIVDEIDGSGDGEPNQTHALQHPDVLDNEDIRVQEAISVEEREQIERESGKDAVTDREDIGGTWVRWREVKALFDCGEEDRCYEIDRAAGILHFGDGVHGQKVPAGVDNIRAFKYRTGGGAIGNVPANKIATLATAVAGIESVFNPTPAGGGSDKATTEEMLTIGPRHISHRDRAVSAEDFEELAFEASRQVAKVRCLRTTNLELSGAGRPDPCDPEQRHEALEEPGFVSLIVVPDSTDPQPCPSLELRRTLKDYLRERAPSIVASGERLVVRPPDYVAVGIQATIFVTSIEKAAEVETAARKAVEQFLHPVHGGPDGKGQEFGRPILKSDVFALLERITDIDRVEDLKFLFRGRSDPERVEIGPNELLSSGKHELSVTAKKDGGLT
ncbi:MAG TPA: putative baseplate assembly protein [Pyrinomonadaceae bacterium]|nr:putative baseplate assembly protein [Pyrinomonadaceae bacterium]